MIPALVKLVIVLSIFVQSQIEKPKPIPTETVVQVQVQQVQTQTQKAPLTNLQSSLEASLWPEWSYSILTSIIACESGGIPTQTGKAGERGLMQVHPVHAYKTVVQAGYTWEQMYQPVPNLNVAYLIWQLQGWGAWSCAS